MEARVNSLYANLRPNVTHAGGDEIYRLGPIRIYKTTVFSQEYIVVAVEKMWPEFVRQEAIALLRATSLYSPAVQPACFAFDQGGDRCFTYVPYDHDLESFLKLKHFEPEILRDVLYDTLHAMHCLHHIHKEVHGNLRGSHNFVLTYECGKFLLRLTGLGEHGGMSTAGMLKDCQKLKEILEDLLADKRPPYFDGLMQNIGVTGCKDLHKAFCFIKLPQQLWYMQLLDLELNVWTEENNIEGWYQEYDQITDWRSECKKHSDLAAIYSYRATRTNRDPYHAGARDFLRFCRDCHEHPRPTATPEAMMEQLHETWPLFFELLHQFCIEENIVISMPDDDRKYAIELFD